MTFSLDTHVNHDLLSTSVPTGWIEFSKNTGHSDMGQKMHQIFEDNKLSPTSLWDRLFRSLVQQALDKYEDDNSDERFIKVNLKIQGPAVTLVITYAGLDLGLMAPEFKQNEICVDLVPCQEFLYGSLLTKHQDKLLAVAKACKYQEDMPRQCQYPDPHLLWRISFSKQEEQLIEYLHDRSEGSTSFVLRFLKALKIQDIRRARNSEFTSKVSSYLLKMSLFHIALPFNRNKWQWSKIPDRLSEIVHFLLNALKGKELYNVFFDNPKLEKIFPKRRFYMYDEKTNLLLGFSPTTLTNMALSIRRCLEHNNLKWILKGLV